jgi:hypothetical protein
MSGFSNTPKILKGAFAEYGYSIPPLIVAFQFNPVTISRDRTNKFNVPGYIQQWSKEQGGGNISLREYHQREECGKLENLRDLQDVEVGSETISFDIRLDATDKLDEGDPIAEQFGIAPQLSTLELMMYPKEESLAGMAISELLGPTAGHSFTGTEKPPMVLFVWGRKKVLPVNLTSMKIKEEEFSTDLNPIRATIGVSLTVIEGPNDPYLYSKGMKEAMSALNLANLTEVANVIVPL